MTNTIKNLTKAFIGESQARNRYVMFAKVAKKEGYEQISAIFTETANQEEEHAKQLFKMINELKKESNEDLNEIKVETSAPTILGNTLENLKSAIAGEKYEHESMYPDFANLAEKEGLLAISNRLKAIGIAENHHEERYKKLLSELEAETIFKKDQETSWICRKCGYQHKGNTPADVCPSCSHPIGYFQIKSENY